MWFMNNIMPILIDFLDIYTFLNLSNRVSKRFFLSILDGSSDLIYIQSRF